MKLKCEMCGAEIKEDNSYDLGNEKICEDCYLDHVMPQNPCDPMAQSATDRFVDTFGEIKPENLLEDQKKVYEFIKTRGKVTTMEVMQKFSMREGDLRQILIVLRRLKLAKGRKISDKVYWVPWDYPG